MRFGVVIPGGAPSRQVELGVAAEEAGWDGVFCWDTHYGPDPWVILAAVAVRTDRVRLGSMLTPLPWRRPWKLAAQVATLDELSAGRAVLTVGLGAADPELGDVGEITDRRTRAELLDEGLAVLDAIWSGDRTFTGRHLRVDLSASQVIEDFGPARRPRPTVWVVGAWPRDRPMRRVLGADGLVPNVIDEGGPRPVSPGDVAAMRRWLTDHGAPPTFDIVVEGETPSDGAAAAGVVGPWEEAGATWWLETRWGAPPSQRLGEMAERIAAGPPR